MKQEFFSTYQPTLCRGQLFWFAMICTNVYIKSVSDLKLQREPWLAHTGAARPCLRSKKNIMWWFTFWSRQYSSIFHVSDLKFGRSDCRLKCMDICEDVWTCMNKDVLDNGWFVVSCLPVKQDDVPICSISIFSCQGVYIFIYSASGSHVSIYQFFMFCGLIQTLATNRLVLMGYIIPMGTHGAPCSCH